MLTPRRSTGHEASYIVTLPARVRNGIRSVMIHEGFKIGIWKAAVAVESANCTLQWSTKPEMKSVLVSSQSYLSKSMFDLGGISRESATT